MSGVQENILKKLLLRTGHRARLWAALGALCIGTTLLLLSVTIWSDFNELLYGRRQNEALGSTFLIIGKRVTEQNMGNPGATVFTLQDIADVQKAPQVEDVGVITSNHFHAYATLGGQMQMATDLPMESVPDKFIDKLPDGWHWQPGSRNLPVIISSQFLYTYNYGFAPSQGLPQLSENSVKSIALNLKIGDDLHTETFLAHVVGFSDRINSVLVPQSFIDYGNSTYGRPGSHAPSQLILKTKDPSDTKFAAYIKQRDYTTNEQNLRWNKIRAIVEVVTSATGILALMLMGIGTLVFILFIELTIARAQQSLALLQHIGYAPRYLSRFMTVRFLPMILGAISVAVAITIAVQAATSVIVKAQSLALPLLPGWPVWLSLIISLAILLLLVTRSVRKAISQ